MGRTTGSGNQLKPETKSRVTIGPRYCCGCIGILNKRHLLMPLPIFRIRFQALGMRYGLLSPDRSYPPLHIRVDVPSPRQFLRPVANLFREVCSANERFCVQRVLPRQAHNVMTFLDLHCPGDGQRDLGHLAPEGCQRSVFQFEGLFRDPLEVCNFRHP